MERALAKVLVRLAHNRWTDIQRQYNNAFMSFGPGSEWERYKEKNVQLWGELSRLRKFCTDNIDLIIEMRLHKNCTPYNGVVEKYEASKKVTI